MESLNEEKKQFFAFQSYQDSVTGKMYLVSKKINNLPELLKEDPFVDVAVMSLLRIKKTISSVPYSFSKQFIGWDLILFPFICFVSHCFQRESMLKLFI
jgi:hypothetical protein